MQLDYLRVVVVVSDVRVTSSEPNCVFQTEPNQTHSEPNLWVFFKNWTKTEWKLKNLFRTSLVTLHISCYLLSTEETSDSLLNIHRLTHLYRSFPVLLDTLVTSCSGRRVLVVTVLRCSLTCYVLQGSHRPGKSAIWGTRGGREVREFCRWLGQMAYVIQVVQLYRVCQKSSPVCNFADFWKIANSYQHKILCSN